MNIQTIQSKATQTPPFDQIKDKLLQYISIASHNSIIPKSQFRLRNLIQQFGSEPIQKLLSKIFVDIQENSGLENVITNPITIDFIISQWIDQNHHRDIREFGIILKSGLFGTYGPTYNKIAIDTIGQWTIAYQSVTYPIIQQRLENHNRILTTNATNLLAAPTSTPIPVPAEIAAKTDELVRKYQVDLTPRSSLQSKKRQALKELFKPPTPKPMKYPTLEDYCIAHNLDFNTYISEKQEIWLMELNVEDDIDFDKFIELRKKQLLLGLQG
jgi:hypothetical protein